MRKIPFAGSNSRPNVSEGYEVPLSYRGDRRNLHNNKRHKETYRGLSRLDGAMVFDHSGDDYFVCVIF